MSNSQHQFVVCFDTKTNSWSIDHEGAERFIDGTVWVPSVTLPSEGEWVQLDFDNGREDMVALAKINESATNVLTGALLTLKNKVSLN